MGLVVNGFGTGGEQAGMNDVNGECWVGMGWRVDTEKEREKDWREEC